MGHPADFPPSFSLRIALTYPFSHGPRTKKKGKTHNRDVVILYKRLYPIKETPSREPKFTSPSFSFLSGRI